MAEVAKAEPELADWRDELDRAAAVLGSARSVALACHLNPDPDAIGSMLGLALYLEGRGKEVVCSWANHPLKLPGWLSVMEGARLIVQPRDFPSDPEVMVALDTASPERLGSLGATAERAREVVVIDHHRTNPGFGTIVVLDPTASSTAELVFRLVGRMGGELPDEAAAALYAGIIADTGRFGYESTSPDTLRVAAELRTHRFDHARMAQVLFEEASSAYLRLLGPILGRLVLDAEASLVWTYLTQADLTEARIQAADTDDLIDLIRTAREADVACVLKQQRDGRFKVSLRSRGGTDVGSVAARFGGGGHRLAAGYTSTTGVEETMRSLIEALHTVRRPT